MSCVVYISPQDSDWYKIGNNNGPTEMGFVNCFCCVLDFDTLPSSLLIRNGILIIQGIPWHYT